MACTLAALDATLDRNERNPGQQPAQKQQPSSSRHRPHVVTAAVRAHDRFDILGGADRFGCGIGLYVRLELQHRRRGCGIAFGDEWFDPAKRVRQEPVGRNCVLVDERGFYAGRV